MSQETTKGYEIEQSIRNTEGYLGADEEEIQYRIAMAKLAIKLDKEREENK